MRRAIPSRSREGKCASRCAKQPIRSNSYPFSALDGGKIVGARLIPTPSTHTPSHQAAAAGRQALYPVAPASSPAVGTLWLMRARPTLLQAALAVVTLASLLVALLPSGVAGTRSGSSQVLLRRCRGALSGFLTSTSGGAMHRSPSPRSLGMFGHTRVSGMAFIEAFPDPPAHNSIPTHNHRHRPRFCRPRHRP